MSGAMRRWWPLATWIGAMALLLAVAFATLRVSYDLSLFLPDPSTAEQEILTQRLGESPGARLVFIATPDDPDRFDRLLNELRELPAVAEVYSDRSPLAWSRPPEPVWSYRYLLSDLDWSVDRLRSALNERLSELGIGVTADYEWLVRHDPTLETLRILESLKPGSGSVSWRLEDGRPVIVAVTEAPAFDMEGQARAVAEVREAVADIFAKDPRVLVSGAGVIGVDLQRTIRSEATLRSLLATLAIITVLILAYRSAAVLLYAAIPLLTGLMVAVTTVALVFGEVHGITFAFGFTLLGVAIDYPLHYLSHRRNRDGPSSLEAVWPTLRLGAVSTMLAYSALILGGARGMAQLGVFSASGVLGALLATRWLLPPLTAGFGPAHSPPEAGAVRPEPRFVHLPAFLLAAVALALAAGPGDWWADDMSVLSPVSAERLATEGRLRNAVGAANMRYQVALRDADLQSALERTEKLRPMLAAATADGLIDGFGDAATLLPSASLQARRAEAIPDEAKLHTLLRAAVTDTPFRPDAFSDFITDAERSRDLQPLTPENYDGTVFEDALAQYLEFEPRHGWTSLVTLFGEPQVNEFSERLAAVDAGALLVDYRSASAQLVSGYRVRTMVVILLVAVLIALLLLWRVRGRRAAWTVGVVIVSVVLTAAGLRWIVGALNLYHLTGLLLVCGIGLDYALFLSRPGAFERDTQHAVFSCAASTIAAFGVLALSAIPALGAIGITVALGSATCLLVAWIGVSRTPNRGAAMRGSARQRSRAS